jgi:hypothetical protein
MTYDIRPLTFGELLDRTFWILTGNAFMLLALAALESLPFHLVIPIRAYYTMAVGAVLLLICVPIQCALFFTIQEIYLGRQTSFGAALRFGWSIWVPTLRTLVLLLLVGLSPYLLLGAIEIARIQLPFGFWIRIVVVWLALVISVCLYTNMFLVTPIMVVEGKFGISALKRSFQLTAGAWWRMLGFFAVVALIVRVLPAALALIWSSIPVLAAILNALIVAIALAYSSIAMILYYFDRRCRTENFDLRLLIDQIRAEGGQPVSR